MTEVLFPTDKFKVLSGVKLPRLDLSWKAANEFFQSQFRPKLGDLDSEIVFMNNVIWSYFKDTCGLVKSANKFEHYLRNRKHFPCFYRVIETRVLVWENEK
jgi:hypothetical protein